MNQTLQGGFDGVSQQLQNQTNQLAMQISQLGYQMDQCLTEIVKTIGDFFISTVGTYTRRRVLAIG